MRKENKKESFIDKLRQRTSKKYMKENEEELSEEIKNLRKIKKRIKEIETIEQLEEMESELDELGVLDKSKLEKLKRKKRKKKNDREIFEERLRCDLEVINKTIMIGKLHKTRQRTPEEKILVQEKGEREKSGGIKDKEKDKDKGERTRSSGGRTRGDR